ncbi:hypothetical protein BLHB2_18140 [Bacillus licheniformis]|nr:hypothetical protein BLHB2_18140 [Bacillus licheniformis]
MIGIPDKLPVKTERILVKIVEILFIPFDLGEVWSALNKTRALQAVDDKPAVIRPFDAGASYSPKGSSSNTWLINDQFTKSVECKMGIPGKQEKLEAAIKKSLPFRMTSGSE